MNALELTAGQGLSPKQKDAFINQLATAFVGMKRGGLLGTAGIAKSAAQAPFLAGVNEGQMDTVIANMINGGPMGLRRLAYSLKLPLKVKLDYVSVTRKVFLVDELPQSDFPIYELDIPEFGAVKLSALGQPIQHDTYVRKTQIPTFVMAIDEAVKYEDINVALYKRMDRAKERVGIAMAIAEDDEMFRVLAAAAAVSPNAPITVSTLSKNALAVAIGKITSNQLIASTVIMNPQQYTDLLRLGSSDLDQVTLNAVVETGYFGSIFGMQLIVSTRCPAGSVYVVTTKDKLGRLPERKKIEVKIFDNVPKGQYDIFGFSQWGLGCHNPSGVVKITCTSSMTV